MCMTVRATSCEPFLFQNTQSASLSIHEELFPEHLKNFELQPKSCDKKMLDSVVEHIDHVAQDILKNLKSCPDIELCVSKNFSGLIKKIEAHIETCVSLLQSNEEAQGVYYFLRSKFGAGEYLSSKQKLQALQNDLVTHLKANFATYQKQAFDHFQKMRFSQALKIYQQLLHLYAEKDDIIEKIADSYVGLGMDEKALLYYNKLCDKEGFSLRCSFKKGVSLMDLGRVAEALTIFEQITQGNTQDMLQKEAYLKATECRIKLGKYVDAIDEMLLAIQKYPECDLFRKKLIDAYLAYSQEDHGDLFRKNFPLLCDYFSKLSCYSPLRRSYSDALQIVLDLFDFSAKRSKFTFSLCDAYISTNDLSDEFLEIVMHHFFAKVSFFEKKQQDLQRQTKELKEEIIVHDFKDEDTTFRLRSKLLGIPEELLGGKKASCPVGLVAYLKFYTSILAKMKEKQIKHKWQQKIAEIEKSFIEIGRSFHSLINEFLKEEEVHLGLRALFAKRLQIHQRNSNFQDQTQGVSTVEWIKRGNLLTFIQQAFVPQDEHEKMCDYLERQGLQLEELFSSDLMNFVPGEIRVNSSKELQNLNEWMSDKKIDSIESLKLYVKRGV